MTPKKMRLATKVQNLVRNRKQLEAENGIALESDVPKAASKTSTTMEIAKGKAKLNLGSLLPKGTEPDKLKSNKRLLRAVVDMEMMKSELKQRQDPPTTPEEQLLSANRLGFEFFDVPSETLAKNLLGKILVRRLENGTILKGKIVETEAYLGGEDRASQTYRNKITPRNVPMYMPPGTIYVYLTYGMYHCFNISSKGDGSGVLIRALAPIEGMDQMTEFRNLPLPGSKSKQGVDRPKKSAKNFKVHELSNGPSKFCIAFALSRDHTKYSACEWRGLWIEDGEENEGDGVIEIVKCPRIGIDSAGPEWAMKPLRFYVLGDRSVSKIDKKIEAELRM
ncbi:putative 3-methyladenine DNA glycosylase [Neodiprion pinetum]|uniref:putative 3-methyladenine DNA glycosylase n=1 Tax=Neodiprion pinetum TaxID=441929 RepID=UPI001EDCD942|nr:DNA-3-methyladenine glycosylase-like [Neodiprion pinetum]XP_046490544.1 DNA-3-methyladenine glycosylase-like [Neodiprion pinetum]